MLMRPETILRARHLYWLRQYRRWNTLLAEGKTHDGELSIVTLKERSRAVLGELEFMASQMGYELRDPAAREGVAT